MTRRSGEVAGLKVRVSHEPTRLSQAHVAAAFERLVPVLERYARVSSEQQAGSNTIASQLAALEARIAADRLTVLPDHCFVDDGYSGASLVRPALERLRDLAASGALDRVYIHSPDRLQEGKEPRKGQQYPS